MLDHRQPLVRRGESSTRPYSSPNSSLAQNPKPHPQITNPKCCLGVSTSLEPCKQGIKPFDFFSYHLTVADLPCHQKNSCRYQWLKPEHTKKQFWTRIINFSSKQPPKLQRRTRLGPTNYLTPWGAAAGAMCGVGGTMIAGKVERSLLIINQ